MTDGAKDGGDVALPLPMFPLGCVLFPHTYLPLHVFEPRYRALARDTLRTDRQFGVVNVQPEYAQGGSGLEASRK